MLIEIQCLLIWYLQAITYMTKKKNVIISKQSKNVVYLEIA